MNDEQILMMGGTQRDIDEYAKNNGADLTEEDVLAEELVNYFLQKCKAVISIKDYEFTKQLIRNIRLKDRKQLTMKIAKELCDVPVAPVYADKDNLSVDDIHKTLAFAGRFNYNKALEDTKKLIIEHYK